MGGRQRMAIVNGVLTSVLHSPYPMLEALQCEIETAIHITEGRKICGARAWYFCKKCKKKICKRHTANHPDKCSGCG